MTSHRSDRWTALVLAVVLAALWLLLSGHYSFEHPLLLILGTASVALVVGLAWRMRLVDAESMPFRAAPRFVAYVPWLLLQVLLSSIDVLRRGLFHRYLEPDVVVVKGSQSTDFGLVAYANSITLTPGTTSLDSDVDADTITVHTISSDSRRSLESGAMDRRVRWVEGRTAPRPAGDRDAETGSGR